MIGRSTEKNAGTNGKRAGRIAGISGVMVDRGDGGIGDGLVPSMEDRKSVA